MLDDAQLRLAADRLQQMRATVTLQLDPGPDPTDRFSQVLCRAIKQLASLVGDRVDLQLVPPGKTTGVPCVSVRNVRYQAVPLGHELIPFLDLLVQLSLQDDPPTGDLATADVRVLIAPTCPNCPQVVAACNQVAAEHPAVALEIIDVQYFREVAGSVKSVPAAIIDSTRTIVGGLQADELVRILRERDSQSFVQSALISMLETGRFAEAVPLLTTDLGQAVLAELLGGSFQHRIGVMLAAREALDRDPHALDGALPHLLPLLRAEQANLRGDTADLLGQIGAPGARDALTRLLSDENPDVRAVAADSLDRLRQPS